ncbi:NYN domain-containing protein [Oscillatoria sp. CS-180]|uniref:YacP-like NYN domain-containing protein n=1 Tax=Oscillatoria sp. CS-180 TaxID=3021720 RepID=UPI002330A92E|nr:NYN domain-containing protein [Oscillatoria sp. CS-180]MDB9525534.1 NYN domain-containing protein [Oscillatoria sp. CS-180]
MKPSIPQPLLFVDGYNIIGAWPQLSRIRDVESLGLARDRLIEEITNYSAYQGFKARIVFDAYNQKQRGLKDTVTQDVSIHYTDFGQTADTCIERWCAELQRDVRYFNLRVIVATSDQAHRHTVTGYGAEWMSAHRLALDMEQAVRQGRSHQRSKAAGKKSKRSRTVLKPAVHDRLRALRAQLEQQPNAGS